MPQLDSRPALPPLPRSVQDIADVIGREMALHLIAHLPRRYSKGHPAGQPNLYVPKMLSVDHVLVRVIGIDAAQKLVAVFGGENLYPAICAETDRAPRDVEILRFLRMGRSTAEIAQWFGVTDRHVRRIRRKADIAPADRIAS